MHFEVPTRKHDELSIGAWLAQPGQQSRLAVVSALVHVVELTAVYFRRRFGQRIVDTSVGAGDRACQLIVNATLFGWLCIAWSDTRLGYASTGQ